MADEMTVKIKRKDFHRIMQRGDTFAVSGHMYKCISTKIKGTNRRFVIKYLGELKEHRPKRPIMNAITGIFKRRRAKS